MQAVRRRREEVCCYSFQDFGLDLLEGLSVQQAAIMGRGLRIDRSAMQYLRIILLGVVFFELSLVFGSARAETVIYKQSERGTTVGHGFGTVNRSQSFILFDTLAQRPLVVIRHSSTLGEFKYYSIITNLSDYNLTRGVMGTKGNETVFFRTLASTNSSGQFYAFAFFARGRDATLDLGNGTSAAFPKTMKGTTRSVDNLLGTPYVFESSAILRFQLEDTRIANTQAETLEQTIERLRLRVEAQGYVRAPN